MASAPTLETLFALSGKVALVTGASSGLGRFMAAALADAGASVVLLARRETALLSLKADIESRGGSAAVVTGDLSERATIPAIAAATREPFGTVHIVVNAAGVNLRQPVDEITLESWDETLNLNLSAPFFLTRELVPGMREAEYGRVINIASLQSYRAFENGLAYGASKGGVTQLTRAMAQAWSGDGIAPGFFPTELTAPVFGNPDMSNHFARQTAIGRNGELEDMRGVSVFLASPACAYITGQVLPVDGGFTAK